ncbi:MAG: DNA replication/repair protein RecF [Hyphomicrobiales bacterium]|nr:DNA replication/repair protein RecF [Hyphomicrobiales bacterium]
MDSRRASSSYRTPRVTRLLLQEFRSYPSLDLSIEGALIVFVGDNGAGKTNLLEALSLFTPGRGLRRADLEEMAREQGPGSFAVSLTLQDGEDLWRLGTGLEIQDDDNSSQRRYRINGASVSSAHHFTDHLRLVCLTPAFDGLFTGPAGDRRRFLDRLVLALDPAHASRVSGLERALRTRNKLLEELSPDPLWLDAIEREVAETGIAVAAARQEAIGRLSGLIHSMRDDTSPFPWADIRLEGWVEAALIDRAAVDVEDEFRALLKTQRPRDRAAGRALVGPQASDLIVIHGPKSVAAERASTGEQKALLIGLVLAHARLVADVSGIAPIILLDEIAAHLDPKRRTALFETLAQLGSQVFMTGADIASFSLMPEATQRYGVSQGQVDLLS